MRCFSSTVQYFLNNLDTLTALDVLLRLVNDEETVVQRVILCAVNIYRRILRLM